MKDKDKTKGQLLNELAKLRQKIAEFEKSENERKQMEKVLQEDKEKLRIMFESIGDGIVVTNLEANIVEVNNAILRMGSYSHKEELIGQSAMDFVSPKDRAKAMENLSKELEVGQSKGDIEYALLAKDGSEFVVESNATVLHDSVGNPVGLINVIRDITERKQAEKVQAALYKISEATNSTRNLEDLFRSIHKTIAELMYAKNFYIALYDPADDIVSFPYFVDELEESLPPRKKGKGLTEYVIRTGKPILSPFEVFKELKKKGEVELIGDPWIDWLGIPLKIQERTIGVLTVQSYSESARYSEEDKSILMFVSTQVAMAIERKRAEEQIKASLKEKEVLLQEVHHRVKNNMQLISSLFNLQSGHIKDKQAFEIFKSSQNRVRSMALIHERLYQSKDFTRVDFAEYSQSLITHLFSSYGINTKVIKFYINIKDVFLDINTAIPCSLIINELISNSLKHAFPAGKKGEIKIAMHPTNKKEVELIISDNGIGLPKGMDFRKTDSLGLHLVNLLAEDQLHGDIKLDRTKGTIFHIKFGRKR